MRDVHAVSATPLIHLDPPGIQKLKSGKVREVFDLGDRLLFVATDRISAFEKALFAILLSVVVIVAIWKTRPREMFVARPHDTSVGILGLTMPRPGMGTRIAAGKVLTTHLLVPSHWRLTRFIRNLPNGFGVFQSAVDQPQAGYSPANSLGIWVGERFPIALPAGVAGTSIARIELIATNSFRFPSSQPEGQQTARWNKGRTRIDFFSAQAFPRRQRTFEVELHDRNSSNSPIRLTVENPFWKPVTNWAPGPFPSQRTLSGTTVSLTRFEPLTVDGFIQTNAFQPVFEISPAPDGTRHWRLGRWELSDASGNWGPILDPSEPAWRVTAQFLREMRGRFPSNQIWTTTLSTFPGGGEFQLANTSVSIGGHSFRIIALAGPGKYDLRHDLLRTLSAEPVTEFSLSRFRPLAGTGGVPELSVASPTPFLLVRCLETQVNALVDQPLGVRLRRADEVELITTGRFRGDADGVRCYPLAVPTNAGVSSLELLLPAPVQLDFTVPPPH